MKVKKLLNFFIGQINEENLTTLEIAELIQQFLYTIGSSKSEKTFSNSEEVMENYYTEPTFWNGLMAQALIMKDKWKIKD